METVDARGEQCPMPVVKAKKAMEALGGAGVIEVLVDNETAVKNVCKMAENAGAKAESEKKSEKEYKITIHVSGKKAEDSQGNTAPLSGDTIVVVDSDKMGKGNDELGKVLMKGFIFALSQLDKLPKTILFYNGGATLSAEGSDSLEDLQKMEAEGVEILTCGTCLNYYEMSDKLKVGSVTNMYTIVEKMADAARVIRP